MTLINHLIGYFSGYGTFQEVVFRTALTTLFQSSISAVAATVLGAMLAFYFSYHHPRIALLLYRASWIIFSLPAFLVCLMLISAYGQSHGLGTTIRAQFQIDTLYGWPLLILGHLFLNIPLSYSLCVQRLRGRLDQFEELGTLLGASNFCIFLKITLPSLLPSLMTSFVIIFFYCFSSFFIPLFLGGSPKYSTLEVLMYQTLRLTLETSRIVQIFLAQLAFTAPLFFLLHRRRLFVPLDTQGWPMFYRDRSLPSAFLATCLAVVLVFIYLAPISFFLKDIVHHTFRLLDRESFHSLIITLRVSFTTLALGILIVFLLFTAWDMNIVLFPLQLPLVISPALLSFLLTFWFKKAELSSFGVSIYQVFFSLPVLAFIFLDKLRKNRVLLKQTADLLGAHLFFRVRYLYLSFFKREILVFALFILFFSAFDIHGYLFHSFSSAPLAIRIFKLMSSYQFDRAFANLGLLLTWITILGIVAHYGRKLC